LVSHDGHNIDMGDKMRAIVKSRGMLAGLALLAAAGMSACSANSAPASAGHNNGQTTNPAAIASTSPEASPAATPAASPSLVPMQHANGGEFASPSGNISCELDDPTISGKIVALCETTTPARSVTMNATGSYTTCTGVQCLGNAGMNTPILAYGQATGIGPFVCRSATTGITCTADGKGFLISRSGITPA